MTDIQLSLFEQHISEANREHALVGEALQSALMHARNAGEALIKAKEQCKKDGKNWLEELAKHSTISIRQTQNYMRLAKEWDSLPNTQSTAFFGIEHAVQYLSAPEEVQQQIDEKLEEGATVTVAKIKKLKEQLKAASDEQEFSKNKIRQLQEVQKRQAEEAQRQINEAQEKALEQARAETEDELLTINEEKAEAEAKANELNQQLLTLQETRQTLQAQIKELERRPPQVEYKTPEKYKEMEEEEQAHEKRLKALKGRIQAAQEQMEAIKKELESMDSTKDQIAFKKSQLKAYQAVLIAFLSNAKKYELHLTDPVTYPGLEEKQKEIDRLKSEVVEFMSRAFAIEVESNQPTLLQ